MAKYELMMILDPALDKTDLDALIKDINADLKEQKLNVTSEDVWGKKDMAYKIHGSDEGYYLIYILETDEPQNLKNMTTPFNIKKGLWRYMFTSVPAEKESEQ